MAFRAIATRAYRDAWKKKKRINLIIGKIYLHIYRGDSRLLSRAQQRSITRERSEVENKWRDETKRRAQFYLRYHYGPPCFAFRG